MQLVDAHFMNTGGFERWAVTLISTLHVSAHATNAGGLWSVNSEYNASRDRLWRLFFFFLIHSLSPVCRMLYDATLN